MPFYASALVLSDGNELAVVADIDAIGFDAEWTDKIIRAIVELCGIPRDHIRFSCSHTHSGPNTFRLATISEGLEMVLTYLNSLPERIAGAVWQAQKNLQRVRFAVGSGTCDINVKPALPYSGRRPGFRSQPAGKCGPNRQGGALRQP